MSEPQKKEQERWVIDEPSFWQAAEKLLLMYEQRCPGLNMEIKMTNGSIVKAKGRKAPKAAKRG